MYLMQQSVKFSWHQDKVIVSWCFPHELRASRDRQTNCITKFSYRVKDINGFNENDWAHEPLRGGIANSYCACLDSPLISPNFCLHTQVEPLTLVVCPPAAWDYFTVLENCRYWFGFVDSLNPWKIYCTQFGLPILPEHICINGHIWVWVKWVNRYQDGPLRLLMVKASTRCWCCSITCVVLWVSRTSINDWNCMLRVWSSFNSVFAQIYLT